MRCCCSVIQQPGWHEKVTEIWRNTDHARQSIRIWSKRNGSRVAERPLSENRLHSGVTAKTVRPPQLYRPWVIMVVTVRTVVQLASTSARILNH